MRENWSNITEEQRAQLFPIILEPYNPEWKHYYIREEKYLRTVFGDKIIRINHIGSTSVAGLLSKPTIDVLVEIAEDTNIETISEVLLDAGYVINFVLNDDITYIKGYTPRGFEGQAVHVHVRQSGDWGELYFRDYLIAHSCVAREYEALKLELQKQFLHDRDGYTNAKGEFINKHTANARLEFPRRYMV